MDTPLHALEPLAATPVAVGLRVAFWTLGCRLNQVDTEGLKAALRSRWGITVVGWHEPADLYILNSCTVTGKADQECRRLARQAKHRHPQGKVVVAGCYAQTQPAALAAVPEIDGVVGNAAKEDVGSWLPALLAGDGPLLAAPDFAARPVFAAPLIDGFSGRSRAFIKVQDGCNLRCTYCLIWQARGPGRSRPPRDVLAQLRLLVEAGYREAILTGIHLGGYGRDLRPRLGLLDLLAACLAEFPGLRLRLGSIHPNEVTPELLAFFARHERLRPHLHISLQSGSSGVLRRMKRPYRAERAWTALRAAAAVAPGFGLGADLIVGFPGESDQEFEDTRRLVAELPFSYLHVFRFSPRPGTPAARMSGTVPPEVVGRRSAVLRDLAAGKREAFIRSQLGTVREAVVEAESDLPGWRQATTDNYLTAMVPATAEPRRLVRLALEDCREGRLFGSVVEN